MAVALAVWGVVKTQVPGAGLRESTYQGTPAITPEEIQAAREYIETLRRIVPPTEASGSG